MYNVKRCEEEEERDTEKKRITSLQLCYLLYVYVIHVRGV